MTKSPYSSVEIGPLMRDVKNKICQQLDMIGLIEDDYGMELLVAGSIISLDLSISQVYEQVWKKHHGQTQHSLSNTSTLSAASSVRDCPPMTVTYRLQVCLRNWLPFSCLTFFYFTCRTLLAVAVSCILMLVYMCCPSATKKLVLTFNLALFNLILCKAPSIQNI
jgi:hypothetical protein